MDYRVKTVTTQIKESYKIILLCLAVGIFI